MKPDTEMSNFEIVVHVLGIIWSPGAEAIKMQQRLTVESLADIPAAVEREGYEICPADLPETVSGFAQIIDGKYMIVVNRAKSPEHQQYTIVHELGHHVLHLNPPPEVQQLGLSNADLAEFQAHMFAAAWVGWVKDDIERERLLKQNPEPKLFLVSSLFFTIAAILVSLAIYLLSRLFPNRSPALQKDNG